MATLPADKSTYTINDTKIRQTDCQYSFGKLSLVATLKFKGMVNDIVALAAGFREGERVNKSTLTYDGLGTAAASSLRSSGKVISSRVTTEDGSATATISIEIPYTGKVAPSTDEPDSRKIVVWQEKSTDYEFPLEIYAGDVSSSSTDYANAGDFQAWKNEKEKNIENYKNFQYGDEADPTQLEARTLALAGKAYKGIESVRRAYPEVVRITRYFNYKADADVVDNTLINKIDEDPDLYTIDSTPNAVWQSKFPKYSWLKASYDVECESTEYEKFWNITVTESWIGIDPAERGAWDGNLYGTGNSRWKFAQADTNS